MHRSRVSTLLIDAPVADVPQAVAFWSSATGATVVHPPGEPQFVGLRGAVAGLVTAVQAVDDQPRYHLDFETDDVDAEVARLVGLGATELSIWEGCHILRAPGGHLVCVIPVHSEPADFAEGARTWP